MQLHRLKEELKVSDSPRQELSRNKSLCSPQGWWQLKTFREAFWDSFQQSLSSTIKSLSIWRVGPLTSCQATSKKEWKCHNREESFRHDHSQVTVHFKSFDKVFTSSEIVINGVSICYSITLDLEKHHHCIKNVFFSIPSPWVLKSTRRLTNG